MNATLKAHNKFNACGARIARLLGLDPKKVLGLCGLGTLETGFCKAAKEKTTHAVWRHLTNGLAIAKFSE